MRTKMSSCRAQSLADRRLRHLESPSILVSKFSKTLPRCASTPIYPWLQFRRLITMGLGKARPTDCSRLVCLRQLRPGVVAQAARISLPGPQDTSVAPNPTPMKECQRQAAGRAATEAVEQRARFGWGSQTLTAAFVRSSGRPA